LSQSQVILIGRPTEVLHSHHWIVQPTSDSWPLNQS
jgi:hypothetical protein